MCDFFKKAGIFAAVLLYSSALFIAGTKFVQKGSDIPAAKASKEEQIYTAKLYNGDIWVFSDGEPLKKLNIDYKNLRLYDKELFAKGVNVRDLRELAELEEDFSS